MWLSSTEVTSLHLISSMVTNRTLDCPRLTRRNVMVTLSFILSSFKNHLQGGWALKRRNSFCRTEIMQYLYSLHQHTKAFYFCRYQGGENMDFICPELKRAPYTCTPRALWSGMHTVTESQFRKGLRRESCWSSIPNCCARLHRTKPRSRLVCGTITVKGSRTPSPQKMLAIKEMWPFRHGRAHVLIFGRTWVTPVLARRT